jgi:hypothetical protein
MAYLGGVMVQCREVMAYSVVYASHESTVPSCVGSVQCSLCMP